ncbi:DUF1573 domain-containing protein [Mucilaginibacter sp. RS28]|uniref:DUF1573 domain-containing protein n=1 Tax=Mucilaginibacter straminoryzae TaxID=2932774 RepID=A0A9X1X3Q3_9SPHI|nr:DUF1573 domain-containing protein [Mucilaginibacter straminoryzae]MCJ8209991.1 DUF1573 domain-containing protein [Mucilaginibacter straminoryzae]
MKKLILTGMIAAAVLQACNQANSNNTATTTGNTVAAPVVTTIKFETEAHDFGKIKQGEITKYDFKFTNTGKSPLIIANATATCGCTTPTFPKKPVAPGETGVVHVEFNSAGKMGMQDKQITVTANTNPADTRVHLVGEVLTPNTK